MRALSQVLVGFGALAFASHGPAQAGPSPKRVEVERVDPLTRGDVIAMLRADYVSFAPFALGDDHDTKAVDKLVGAGTTAWIETKHFKLGCALDPLTVPEGASGDAMRAELMGLRAKFPQLEPRQRTLSTWLRAHVYAHRLEALYAEVEKLLGVNDDDFPQSAQDVRADRATGEGPYLGQKGKFIVLLFDRAGSFARYAREFTGSKQRFSMRHYFARTDSLAFVTCEEFAEGKFREDAALHAHVAFHVVHNLLDGYLHYDHVLPVWFTEGAASWYVRKLDPVFTSWTTLDESQRDWLPIWDWRSEVEKLVRSDTFTPAGTMTTWLDYESVRFADRMVFWSRVEWLLGQGGEKFALFVKTLKQPLVGSGKPGERTAILARQDEALKRAYGLDMENFDKLWKRWVIKTSPKR